MDKNKLQHPLFLLSVFLLLLNDFYLKSAFGNSITGKLSDFAGLFAFPFFFSCIFPDRKKLIHVFTAILFIWWKSSFSQFFIDGVNCIGIPIYRTIDFSDNMALISILASYYIISRKLEYIKLKPLFLYPLIFISCFAFTATSLAPRTAIEYSSVDKEYEFNIPLYSFIYKYNEVMKKEMDKFKEYGRFNEEENILYSNNKDTLIYLIDPLKHNNSDTINLNYYMANIQIYGDDKKTTLKLIDIIGTIPTHKINKLDTTLNIRTLDPNERLARYPIRNHIILKSDSINKDKIQKKAIKEFEKRIIKKIK